MDRWDAALGVRFPDYDLLGPRRQSLLHMLQIGFPHEEQLMLDVSQDTPSGQGKPGICPCLRPEPCIWVSHRARRLRAAECIFLQGIFLDRQTVERWGGCDSRLLQDLAGNAFNTLSFQAVFVSWLAVVGKSIATTAAKTVPLHCFDADNSDSEYSLDWSDALKNKI